MDSRAFAEVARYGAEKHVHVPLRCGERTKVVLLCLSPGLTVPPHTYPGCEVTLQPLQGRAVLPAADRDDLELQPGRIYFADGDQGYSLKNPYTEPFEMLIHLIRR